MNLNVCDSASNSNSNIGNAGWGFLPHVRFFFITVETVFLKAIYVPVELANGTATNSVPTVQRGSPCDNATDGNHLFVPIKGRYLLGLCG